MSNYKTHSAFNLLLALPILVSGLVITIHPPLVLLMTFGGAFSYSTLFMSPDLDLVHQIKLVSLRGVLSIPFRFYSKVFKHRGLSHSPFIGSATRILWLAGVALIIFYLVYNTIPSEKSFWLYYKKYKLYLLYGFAGICVADWCHLLLDRKK